MSLTTTERKRLQNYRNHVDPDRKYRKLDSIYMFENVRVSVIIDGDGNIWFKGVDLARALEIQDPSDSINQTIDKKYCKSYEALSFNLIHYQNIPGLHPQTTFVNEAGCFKFIMRSRKPKAESFADWIYERILPETRSIQRSKIYETYEERRRNYFHGFFYLFTSEKLKAQNLYKIGYAKDVRQNLSSLNVGRVDDLLEVFLIKKVDNVFEIDKILRCLIKYARVRGKFYKLDEDDLRQIKKVLNVR